MKVDLKFIISLITIFTIWYHVNAQDIKVVWSEYTYYTSESTSIEVAKRIAQERAKIQVIADEFGTNISQSSLTSVSNINNNSDVDFYLLGLSDVKGEWIETIGVPVFNVNYDYPILSVTCKIKGRIREILQPHISLEAKTLKNGLTKTYESTEFKDGDDLFLYFKSSLSGNIMIFLVQGEIVYRLLPYKRDEIKEYAIDGGKEYVFFSKSYGGMNKNNIDEYELFADKEIDCANILILFTPNEIGVTDGVTTVYDEPLSMDFDVFNKWLINKRVKDNYSRLEIIPITIRRI